MTAIQERPLVSARTVEVGQVFRPFDTLDGLRLADGLFQDQVKSPIVFKGVSGDLILCPYLATYKPTRKPLVPFGEVRLSWRYAEGELVPEEAPVEVLTSFRVSDLEQFEKLQGYVIEFSLDSRRFFMRCNDGENEKGVKRIPIGSKLELTTLVDVLGRRVLLPGRINIISQIQVRIIEAHQIES